MESNTSGECGDVCVNVVGRLGCDDEFSVEGEEVALSWVELEGTEIVNASVCYLCFDLER